MAHKRTPQAGVLPYRVRGGQLEICLITSRRTGLWGIPKGHLEAGMTPAEIGAMEAFEEAGLVGQTASEALGSYTYRKYQRVYQVEVFPLKVEQVMEDWQEKEERQRRWFAPHELTTLKTHALRKLLQRFVANQT